MTTEKKTTRDGRTKAQLLDELSETQADLVKERRLRTDCQKNLDRMRVQSESFEELEIERNKLQDRVTNLEKESQEMKGMSAQAMEQEGNAEKKERAFNMPTDSIATSETEDPHHHSQHIAPRLQPGESRHEPQDGEGILRAVTIKQANHEYKSDQHLRSNLPFRVFTDLHFCEALAGGSNDDDARVYLVRAIVKDTEETPIFNDGIAEYLLSGKEDYEDTIDIPALDTGQYLLNIYAAAPSERIEQHKQIKLVVD